MVGEDDLRHGAVAVDGGDDLRALVRVALDQLPVLVVELGVGLEDVVGKDELADVVQQRGDVHELLLALGEAGALGDRAAVARDGGAVTGGHLVAEVEGPQHRAQHSDLQARELLGPRLELLGPLLGYEQSTEQVLEDDQHDAEQPDRREARSRCR